MTTTSASELTASVNAAIHSRYQLPKWVLIPEAPSHNVSGRRCDAIAIGVWGSTQNQIIGHEVKASRSDWVKELQEPEKAEMFSLHCDRWYVVAPTGIVELEELQPSWGLMELTKSGNLKIRKQSPKNENPKPIHRNMMASWLRRVSQGVAEAERARIRSEAQTWATDNQERRLVRLERENQQLRSAIDKFEAAAGIRINRWDAGHVGEAVHAIMKLGTSPVQRMEQIAKTAEMFSGQAKAAAEEMAKLTTVQRASA